MIIGFQLMYNFNFAWLKQRFSRGYKLLHVFWNTLYMCMFKRESTEINGMLCANGSRNAAADKIPFSACCIVFLIEYIVAW